MTAIPKQIGRRLFAKSRQPQGPLDYALAIAIALGLAYVLFY